MGSDGTVSDFERALAFVLRWEGGKVDDPHDKGGRTNRGITQRTYDGWRDEKGLPRRDVYELEEEELQAIYRTLYWWPAKLLSWPLNLVVFDSAVLFGAGRAGAWLAAVSWLEAAPAAQAWAATLGMAHRMPQPPQWAGLVARLASQPLAASPSQLTKPAAQAGRSSCSGPRPEPRR